MADLTVVPASGLRGEITPPGDKSLSHRAVMLSSIAEGRTEIRGFLAGEDTLNTAKAMRGLGVPIEDLGDGRMTVEGRGLRGLAEPTDVIDLGNSGTGMRLLAGLLAGQDFHSVLTGDQYLRKRPMGRIADPLRLMGAGIDGREGGRFAPLSIRGAGKGVRPVDYRSPIASAQVKSAVLLCGLYADGETSVTEPSRSRDHTERMLSSFGAVVRQEGQTVSIRGGQTLISPGTLMLPSDISSAAFFLVAATIVPGSDLLVRNVGVNPTRTGVLDVLSAMGADLSLENERVEAGEPVADIRVRHARLRGATVGGDLIPRLIDEIPVLAVAAAVADGTTVIRDAAELRVKESDRITTTAAELAKLGAAVRELPDGLEIDGRETLQGAVCDSHGDHRVAMALAVAGTVARGATVVKGSEWIETSFPGFGEMLHRSSRRA